VGRDGLGGRRSRMASGVGVHPLGRAPHQIQQARLYAHGNAASRDSTAPRWSIAYKNKRQDSGASEQPSRSGPPPKQPIYRQQARKISSKGGFGSPGGGLIVLMVGVAVNGGIGGGNFRMTAYQGVDHRGRTNVDFDTVKANAVGKPIVLNLWGGSCPPCRAGDAGLPGRLRAQRRRFRHGRP